MKDLCGRRELSGRSSKSRSPNMGACIVSLGIKRPVGWTSVSKSWGGQREKQGKEGTDCGGPFKPFKGLQPLICVRLGFKQERHTLPLVFRGSLWLLL